MPRGRSPQAGRNESDCVVQLTGSYPAPARHHRSTFPGYCLRPPGRRRRHRAHAKRVNIHAVPDARTRHRAVLFGRKIWAGTRLFEGADVLKNGICSRILARGERRRRVGVTAGGSRPRLTLQARGAAPGPVGKAPSRRNRTRNSRRVSASGPRRSPCSRTDTGRRPQASSPSPDGRSQDRSASSVVRARRFIPIRRIAACMVTPAETARMGSNT